MTDLEFLQAFEWYLNNNRKNIPLKNNFENYLFKFSTDFIDYYNQFSYDWNVNGEFELLKKISKFKLNTIFDVGANVGDWLIEAKNLFPESDIHAFELSKLTFATLTKNIGQKKVKLNNFGLSNEIDKVIAYKDYGENSGVNTILLDASFNDPYIKHTIVESSVTTGDYYCSKNLIQHIDFLKIDVEGAESLVLEGFNDMLRKKRIRIIQFEYGYHNGDAKFLMRDFFNFFEKFGYKVAKIKRGGISFLPWKYSDNDFKSGPNYVAVRADDSELINCLSDPNI